MSHHPEHPTLAALAAERERDYLALDIVALIEANGLVPFLSSLGRALAMTPHNGQGQWALPRGTDRRLVDAAILLENTGA